MRVSVVMAVWNTAHLLRRTLHTLVQQTYDDFEVIVIDDNSEDDVAAVVEPFEDQLDVKVHRLEHSVGMRGNTVSFNVAFSLAQGELILENTPEIMFYPETIQDMVNAIQDKPRPAWVSIRTYNLTPEDQLLIDTVDWKADVAVLETLPNFSSPWTQNNKKNAFFGTHQTCIFHRTDWFKYWVRYPLFCDYGTDDPWNAVVRGRRGIDSSTIEPFVYHQWHAPIAYWMSQGKAPYWNKWGHTLYNVYNDPAVHEGGTAMIWDADKEEGAYAAQTQEDRENWSKWAETVAESGFTLRGECK